MVYGNQLEIRQFLTAVAQGFVQTRLDMLLLFLFLLGLVVAFAAYLATQKRAVREAMRATRERLQRLLANLDLSQRENALLESLAGLLEGKGREADSKEYALMQSRHLFDSSARKALQAGIAAEVELNALRMKIGFRPARLEEAPASQRGASRRPAHPAPGESGEAAACHGNCPGAGLPCRAARSEGWPTVRKRRWSDSLLFQCRRRLLLFHMGQREITRHPAFSSTLLPSRGCSAGRSTGAKSDFPSLSKRLRGTRLAGNPRSWTWGQEEPASKTLSNQFARAIYWRLPSLPGIEKLALAARVIRVSEDRTIIHVKFESPTESERDRIMRFLFRPSGAAA